MVLAVSSDSSDVVSFLQNAGERYKQHVELLRQKHLEGERKRCTFKPRVTEFAENMSRHSTTRKSEAIAKRLHELHAKRLEMAEARRAEGRERHEAEMMAEVRAPEVTARARSLVSRDPVDASRQWLKQREEKMTRLREEALRKDLASLREVPCITRYAQEMVVAERQKGQSIENYLMAKEEARQKRMYWLAEQGVAMNSSFSNSSFCRTGGDLTENQQYEEQPAFTPRITEYAKQLHRSGNVVNRLLAEGAKGKKIMASAHDNNKNECTFTPWVAPASLELSKAYYSDPNTLVYDRLYRNDASKLCEMRHKKRRDMSLENELRGIPRISETSRLIVERKRAEKNEKGIQESPTNRLYSSSRGADKHDREQEHLLQERKKLENETYTFRPQINAASERMWKRQLQLLQEDGYARTASGARELLWQRSQKRMDEEIQRRRAMEREKEMSDCTFHPKVGRSPERRVDGSLSVPERSERWRLRRDRRLRDVRRELELSELSACSFRPAVEAVYPLPVRGVAAVLGYEAHVMRQEESRRRRQEAQEWWRPRTAQAGQKVVSPAPQPKQRRGGGGGRERGGEEMKLREPRPQGGTRSVSSRRSCNDFSSDVDPTEFVVHQAPSRASSVSLRSLSSSPPPQRQEEEHQYHHHQHYSQNSHRGGYYGVGGTAVQSIKQSPVDFIINHQRAIVESSQRP